MIITCFFPLSGVRESSLGKLLYFFRPRGRHTWTHCAFLHSQKKDNNNLKTKNNQNCQKIELYGSPTTKEIKQKRSYRPVGGVETGSLKERTHSKAAAGRLGQARRWLMDRARWQLADQVVPHLCADKLGGTLGSETDHAAQGSCGEVKPQISD